MSTLIGVLVDVSGSMKENATGEVQGGDWVRSIFTVIDNLIQNNISDDNSVFAVGVGSCCTNNIFDVLGTINHAGSGEEYENLEYYEIIEKSLNILETNGAHSIRKWANYDVIESAIPYDMALFLLRKLDSNKQFLEYFVHICLPLICRDVPKVAQVSGTAIAAAAAVYFLPFPLCLVAPQISYMAYKSQDIFDTAVIKTRNIATKDDIVEVVRKAKDFFVKKVDDKSVISVQEASEIIHGYVDEKELSQERVNKLMKIVEPFIYGLTPLFEALKETMHTFSKQKYRRHNKLLFVLSDGAPTDEGYLQDITSGLIDAQVHVVSCYISKSAKVEPKRLYSLPQSSWDENARFLFELSSTITTQLLPRAIFIKRGWHIDINNNETKMFLHANHPEILKDACDLARNVVCSQDALSDLLVSVSLDIYINQSTTGFGAKEQHEGTCYANAISAVLHLAMRRILGRRNGYPNFNELRQEIILQYGNNGANTMQVLEEICPRYRLNHQQVDTIGAMKAITAKRPVVATFRLTDPEWKIFGAFFENNPTGILSRKVLTINRPTNEKLGGHAVVLTSYNSECLQLMNSWGNKWADMGFFRIENASVLDMKFMDVFWTLNDLTEEEKNYYEQHGSEVLTNLFRILNGLQTEQYKCPKCSQYSLVTDFSGNLLDANCPKCHQNFDCDEPGNILTMNMYLSSLSH